MFEVIMTYRADFREKVMDRCATPEEAAAAAARLSANRTDKVIRVWIRHVPRVETKP